MLMIQDDDPIPKDVQELVSTTRENNRNFEDYNLVLERLSMPPLSSFSARTILEIGTGSGNALAGAHEHFGPDSHIVSLDINELALRRLASGSSLPIEFHTKVRAGQLSHSGIDVTAVSIEDSNLPEAYFDFAYSIWVFYQVKDKLAALRNTLRAVKPGGTIVMVSSGSICTVPRRPTQALVMEAREFVWKHRASRFSWLTGVRELEYFMRDKGQPHMIKPVDAFLSSRLGIEVTSGVVPPEFPAGNYVLIRPDNSKLRQSFAIPLELVGFVSTKNSAFVPIYYDPEF